MPFGTPVGGATPLPGVPPTKAAEEVVVLVTNSNVKHELSGSEYPDRVRQCQDAVATLKPIYPEVTHLRDVTLDMLTKLRYSLNNISYARAKHCVTEDARTLAAVKALRSGDFETVGKNMSESHDSLSQDYEVSCVELDILKRLALEVPGVYGSRMTGGGFGGCTVTLVKKSAVEALTVHLQTKYKQETGIDCYSFEALPSAGAGAVDLRPYLTLWTKENVQSFLNVAVPLAAVALAVTVAYHSLRK